MRVKTKRLFHIIFFCSLVIIGIWQYMTIQMLVHAADVIEEGGEGQVNEQSIGQASDDATLRAALSNPSIDTIQITQDITLSDQLIVDRSIKFVSADGTVYYLFSSKDGAKHMEITSDNVILDFHNIYLDGLLKGELEEEYLNNYQIDNTLLYNGGGIVVRGKSHVTINNPNISHCGEGLVSSVDLNTQKGGENFSINNGTVLNCVVGMSLSHNSYNIQNTEVFNCHSIGVSISSADLVLNQFQISDSSHGFNAIFSNIALSNGYIERNYGSGGAAINDCNAEFTNVEFNGNSFSDHSNEWEGGGLRIGANGRKTGNITETVGREPIKITNCTFSQNSATKGGGLFVEYNEVRITDTNFYENYASEDGGGISANGTLDVAYPHIETLHMKQDAIIIKGGQMELNTGDFRGGAIYLYSISAQLDDVEIRENSAGLGGAINYSGFYNQKVDSENLTLKGNTIVEKNNSKEDGGGICFIVDRCDYSGVNSNSTSFLSIEGNTKLSGNNASGVGGGVYFGFYDCLGMEDPSKIVGASLFVKDNALFEANQAIYGGAIYINRDSQEIQGTVVLTDNAQFCSNEALEDGGAIWMDFDYLGNITAPQSASNVIFTKNKARTHYYIKAVDISSYIARMPGIKQVSNNDYAYNNADISYKGGSAPETAVEVVIKIIYEDGLAANQVITQIVPYGSYFKTVLELEDGYQINKISLLPGVTVNKKQKTVTINTVTSPITVEITAR